MEEKRIVRNARWLSVYGASVALQVHQRFREGRGAPDEDDFERYVEEAASIADCSEEAQPPEDPPPGPARTKSPAFRLTPYELVALFLLWSSDELDGPGVQVEEPGRTRARGLVLRLGAARSLVRKKYAEKSEVYNIGSGDNHTYFNITQRGIDRMTDPAALFVEDVMGS